MRIACPKCGATYEVPEDRLAAGRAVRCARCATTWSPGPPPPAIEVVPEPLPAPAPSPEPPVEAVVPEPAQMEGQGPTEPDPPPPAEPAYPPAPAFDPPVAPPAPPPTPSPPDRRPALAAAWVLSLAVLAALAWAAVAYRADIVRAWPPAERAYVLLGLLPPPPAH